MIVIICMDEKKWVLMSSVEGMLGNEILAFDEVFPFFTHTLESNYGFDGKPCENVGDYLKVKEWCFDITCHVVARGSEKGQKEVKAYVGGMIV